jgi:hypothetical protein
MGSRGRTRQRLLSLALRLRTAGIALFLVAAVTAFALVLAARSPSHQAAPATGNTPEWVNLPSTAPADVTSAARSTQLYQEIVASAQTQLGKALAGGTLGTPVLVHAYHPAPGMTDVWVVPVLDGSSGSQQVVALLDFAYDAPNHRIRATSFAGPFVPGDPEYEQPFPRYTTSQAMSHFASARVATIAPTAQPELVYFPADLDKISGTNATIHWTGGGQFADLAVWRIPAANGQDYLVGMDGRVYADSELPLAPNASK